MSGEKVKWVCDATVAVFALILISMGSDRWCCTTLRIRSGKVAENSTTCFSSGICCRMPSTSSMNPMRSISSASSITTAWSAPSFNVLRRR